MTNDGATILQSIVVDNAAAKVLIDIARTQDSEVGDGTTSVTVLCGELLREAEKLAAMRIHPMTVAAGWRTAVDVARSALEASSVDHSSDEAVFRDDLFKIARTTLSSKLVTHEKDHFAKLAVDAIFRVKDSLDLDHIQIIKKAVRGCAPHARSIQNAYSALCAQGGKLSDSFLEEGILLAKTVGVGQPKRMEGAKIMVANTSMDTDKIKVCAPPVSCRCMLPSWSCVRLFPWFSGLLGLCVSTGTHGWIRNSSVVAAVCARLLWRPGGNYRWSVDGH